MDTHDLTHTLTKLIAPLLDAQNIELVELVVSGSQRRKMVRLFVDRPQGITIGQCAALSREIGDLFDTHDPIEGHYTLEVSSPGLTRPLKTDRDFERVIGKTVRIVADGHGVLVGVLKGVEPVLLQLDVDGQDTGVERSRIQKATLHIEL